MKGFNITLTNEFIENAERITDGGDLIDVRVNSCVKVSTEFTNTPSDYSIFLNNSDPMNYIKTNADKIIENGYRFVFGRVDPCIEGLEWGFADSENYSLTRSEIDLNVSFFVRPYFKVVDGRCYTDTSYDEIVGKITGGIGTSPYMVIVK